MVYLADCPYFIGDKAEDLRGSIRTICHKFICVSERNLPLLVFNHCPGPALQGHQEV